MTKDKGLTVFITKNAEAEPWLVPHAFVTPPGFEYFKASSSSLVYARSGAGKTAISCALAEYARNELKCLPVRWTPNLTSDLQPLGTKLAMAQFSSMLSACAHEILVALSKGSKKWAKNDRNLDFMSEFLHHYAPQSDQEFLTKLVPTSKSLLIKPETPLETIATELINNMPRVDFPGGIWIMADRLDWNSETQKQVVTNIIQSILSTLPLFEITNFHFKMFLPMELERSLTEIPARVKERVTATRILWEAKQLQAMIEKRLRFALGDDQVQASQVYPPAELFAWLEACGGLSPRGWLEYFRPIFATVWENYTSEGLRALSKEEWTAARKRSSLQLRFYPASNQVVVGMNSPKTLSQEDVAFFSYLYKNEGHYCSKHKLYNEAYLPFNKGQGRELGPNDELTKEFDDLLNSAIHRLRKSIEPLPKDPVFLTMKKNLGYRLSLQAFSD